MRSCCALFPFTQCSYRWGEAPVEFTAPALGGDQPSRLYLSAPATPLAEPATPGPPGAVWLRSAHRYFTFMKSVTLRLFFE
jgi:hypothetical protein